MRDGIIGDFRFDRYGDMTPAKIPVFRVRPGKPREGAGTNAGAELDRVVTAPTDLAG